MDWKVFLAGLPIMLFNAQSAIFLWANIEVPFWQTVLTVILWTSFTLIITFLFTGKIKERLSKAKIVRQYLDWFDRTRFQTQNNKRGKKFLNWLLLQKNWVIILSGFLPIPGLATASIIVTKIIGIRLGLIFLLLVNSTKVTITCAMIYGIMETIFSFFS